MLGWAQMVRLQLLLMWWCDQSKWQPIFHDSFNHQLGLSFTKCIRKTSTKRYLSLTHGRPAHLLFFFPFLSVYIPLSMVVDKEQIIFVVGLMIKVIWGGHTSTRLNLILCTIQSEYKEKVLMILNLVTVSAPSMDLDGPHIMDVFTL